MKSILLVFVGGGLGSVLRFWFGKLFNNPLPALPYGTWISNFLACLIFGIMAGFIYNKLVDEDTKKFVLTGFCGGLSTFSSFNFELYELIRHEQFGYAIVYLVGSLITCLVGFSLSFMLMKMLLD